jgi:hypothetical protein
MDTVPGWIECVKALEFIDQLQAMLLENRLPEMSMRYIFRGQGDIAWGLLPSALRSGAKLGV